MVNDDKERRLRDQLARLTGPARVRPLMELSQILADRYWRIGPGQASGQPALDDAIACLVEAHGMFGPGDPLRAQIAAQSGWLLSARHVAHGGPNEDREQAIELLEEAVAAVGLPPVFPVIARFALGQLYVAGLSRGLATGNLAGRLSGAPADPATLAEAERAVECFREVVNADQLGVEVAEATKVMLELAEAMRDFYRAPKRGAPFDLGPMMRLMTTMQEMQQRMEGGVTAGLPIPSLFDLSTQATGDPLDRPVAVVTVPDGAEQASVPTPRPAATPPDPATLRRALRERLGGDELNAALAALLRPGAPAPRVGLVDDLVGLASSVVHAAGVAATAQDQITLAVALYLRGRDDADDGWGDTDDDVRSAAAHLLAATDALPADPFGVVPLAVDLAGLLDERHPAGRLGETLRASFAPVAAALHGVRVAALGWPRADGLMLLHTETGRFDRLPPARALPDRLAVVGGPLPDDDQVVVSAVTSARQAAELARRVPMRVTEAPVLVSDPCGDRGPAEVERLRRLYPRSIVLGRVGSGADGAGTPDDVLAHLDASMLHLDCDVDADGALALAGPAALTPAAITGRAGRAGAEGGLAVLPPVGAQSAPLADALLTAGFTAVVDWVRPIPRPVATLMLTLLHTELVRGGLRPAAAVRAVGRRLRAPGRIAPTLLPATLAGRTDLDLTDPAYRTAMVLRGL
ncbi:hypothetical protein ONO23_03711 [Micromonospora noduli]|uniref:hypothetical protein n=1 Tax=Micromonospora noduli TaxID=709876 RepID=UPI000DC026B1|nr:hypothetical protein [Micromonospora noduli]RAO31951.1 hypothetical protein ONO23_03711 [Micromonospora noduli]